MHYNLTRLKFPYILNNISKKYIKLFFPDGKSQVSINYVNGKPQEITKLTLAVQHDEDVELDKIEKDMKEFLN